MLNYESFTHNIIKENLDGSIIHPNFMLKNVLIQPALCMNYLFILDEQQSFSTNLGNNI